ncbi:glycosyl hydrolase family 16 [Aquimarina celericrescens]|uniref:Glycosyl hydrolase family 16 n=1 Tax=Aquimarina celericrescens TaxID=1964542 RepID=A0ABW5ARK4_9FLAO|nr:glycosyl hydrolase family 16 [Aquimarina celericrescens]
MKNRKHIDLKTICSLTLVLVLLSSCERGLSDEAVFATFPNTADIYTDSPVGLTDEFFKSFDPALGANTEAFGTDDDVAFEGNSSIRIDVPAPDDPNGNFVGGIFLDRGEGRDLTGYTALSFWAKGSITATIGLVGFGTDFEDNKFAVERQNIQLSTDWRKYIVPIPDPSKLIQEKGMFVFSAGGFDIIDAVPNGNEIGYTFWLDELKFENLGTVAQLRPAIFSGQDLMLQTFVGSTVPIFDLDATFNGPTGEDITVAAAPSYFDFSSSNTDVAFVNELGLIEIVGLGIATITAQLDGVAAQGSLEITASAGLESAPEPTLPPENVKSIFSDVYDIETASNFTPEFGGSTTDLALLLNGDDFFLSYTNNNFTGILFDNTVDASTLTFLHVDVYIQDSSGDIGLQIRDAGANQEIETDPNTGFPIGDDKDFRFDLTGLTPGQWTSFEIPLAGDIANQKNNLGGIILTGGPNFILDNIYFYRE